MLATYIVRRLLLMIPVLLGITILTFGLVHLVPGDPVTLLLASEYDEQVAEYKIKQLGLDKPIPVQYVLWLSRAVRGDLGRSISRPDRVTEIIAQRLPRTLYLSGGAMIVALLLAVPLGVFSATRRGRIADHASRIVALVGVSMPVFWLGLILLVFFAGRLRWLPVSGDISRYGIKAMILPMVALGTSFAALTMRMVRASMLEVLRSDYIRTARAKGVAEGKVHYWHALRNALIPVVTVVGMQFGHILGGAVLTETVFNIAGMGRLYTEAIFSRDYPLIQGCLLVTATLFVFINLVVDVLYALIDPRIRY